MAWKKCGAADGKTIQYTTLKVRLYPTQAQAELFEKTFGCCHWLWNRVLADERRFETNQQLHPHTKRRPTSSIPAAATFAAKMFCDTSAHNSSSAAENKMRQPLLEHRKHPDNPYTFPSPKAGTMYDPDFFRHTHEKILAVAWIEPIRFYDLGHTFATHALASGVDAKTLSGILGHTDAAFTLNTYTHVTGDMQKQAAAIVGNFMEDIFGKELKPWQNAENEVKGAST